MDFSLSSSGRHNSSLNDISIKSEPMDFDSFNNHHSKESLNTFGPQVATFHPEANSSDARSVLEPDCSSLVAVAPDSRMFRHLNGSSTAVSSTAHRPNLN